MTTELEIMICKLSISKRDLESICKLQKTFNAGGASLGGAGKGDGKSNKDKEQQEVPLEDPLSEDRAKQNPENDDQDSLDINHWIILDQVGYSIAYPNTGQLSILGKDVLFGCSVK